MVHPEEVKDQFSALGIDLETEALETCVAILSRHNVSISDLVDCWIAYSLSNLSGAEPNKDQLLEMESASLLDEYEEMGSPRASSSKDAPDSMSSPAGPSHDASTLRNTTVIGGEKSTTSGTENSQETAPIRDQRESPGTLLMAFGPDFVLSTDQRLEPYLKCYRNTPSGWKTVPTSLFASKSMWNDMAEDIAERLIVKNNLPEPLQLDQLEKNQTGLFIGRVCTNGERLALKSILVRGTVISQYQEVPVDCSQLKEYAIFPGQVIAFLGKAEDLRLTALKLYTCATLDQMSLPPLSGVIRLMVAVGPFTYPEDLLFEPLMKFAEAVEMVNPDGVILVGPLVSSATPAAQGHHDQPLIDIMVNAVATFKSKISGSCTKFFLVSNHNESCGNPVYPTPQLKDLPSLYGVQVVPDPILLQANDVVIGITSADILMQLGKNEISNMTNNRLERLSSHVIQQQCFFPLYPCNDIPVDIKCLYSNGRFPITPHVLILPSDLHYFVKNIEGCAVINPERVSKGPNLGTYADIQIQLDGRSEWSPPTHIAVKIVKL